MVYDFVCDACQIKEEIVKSMKDDSPIHCKKCTLVMRQIISGGGFILKGEGWTGQDIKRSEQDNYIKSVSKRARELKETGKVPMEEILTFKDTDRLNPE